MAPNRLEQMLGTKKAEIDKIKREKPIKPWDVQRPNAGDFYRALAYPGISLVAEIKKTDRKDKPFAGDIHPGHYGRNFRNGGAMAIAVYTDERFYGGSLRDIIRASDASGLPILQMDLILDPYQIYQADQLGASAVLLLPALLGDGQISEIVAAADSIGMDLFAHVESSEELQRAVDAGIKAIGVSNYGSSSGEKNLQRTLDLFPKAGKDTLVVSMGGIKTAEEVKQMKNAGVHAVMIGEALLTSQDPKSKVRELMEIGSAK